MTTYSPDITVIGGGAAGLGAAMSARSAGADVVLVERARLGGECTWTGCVPSKTVIEYARRVHHARSIGMTGAVDSAVALRNARQVASAIGAEEDAPTLSKLGITVLPGHARFVTADTLDIDGTRVTSKTTIVATGSTAAIPPVPGLRELDPLTNDTFFALERLPERLAIIGAGPIGLELGQACRRLGSAVTVADVAPRVAIREEPETSARLERVLTDEGVVVHTGVTLERVHAGDDGISLDVGGGTLATVDRVLVAAGRRPVTDGLDLDRAGVEVGDDGAIVVDRRMRTSTPGVFAVGDVTAFPRLTHAGYRMGQIAAHNARSRLPWTFAPDALPWAVFTDPEVGRVGLTEAQAYERWGGQARVVVFPIRKTDRARTSGADTGFVKLVAAPHPVLRSALGGRLVGATVVCANGGDVIGELALAVRTRTVVARLAQTVHAYPTWSFGVWEALARFFGTHKGAAARPARSA